MAAIKNMTQEQAMELCEGFLDLVDVNDDGNVTLDDLETFGKAIAKVYNISPEDQEAAWDQIEAYFHEIDANGDGVISPEELFDAVSQLSEEDIEAVVEGFIYAVDGIKGN